MKAVKIVTHYSESDPAFDGDYTSIEVFRLADALSNTRSKLLAAYGDAYHDRGHEKVEGFVKGLKVCYPELRVTEKNIADGEAWD